MKFSNIINTPLSWLGLKLARISSIRNLESFTPKNIEDIEADLSFMNIYRQAEAFTMVEIERCYALYKSVQYILRKNILGDFVECGVWRGGSAMLMALTLLQEKTTDRTIYLYDTFSGMPQPEKEDGQKALQIWDTSEKNENGSDWCFATYDDVHTNMMSTGYPAEKMIFVEGDVEKTIPSNLPEKIALLRLDTDWYASTKHELIHLYPLLEKSGILIVDDYGAWEGARKAVDEYFENAPVYLHRIDETGRLLMK